MALGNVDAPRARLLLTHGRCSGTHDETPETLPGGKRRNRAVKRHNHDSSPAWFFLLRGLLYMFHVGAGHCY